MPDGCAEHRDRIWRALDGEGPPEESAALAAHLRACADCRAALRGAVRLQRGLHESSTAPVALAAFLAERRPRPVAPARRPRVVRWLGLGLGAGLALACALLLGRRLWPPPAPPGDVLPSPTGSRPIAPAPRLRPEGHVAATSRLPQVGFATPESRAGERGGAARIAVALDRPADRRVSVSFSIAGGSADPVGCAGSLATGGRDLSPAAGTLVFAPGETRQEIALALGDDRLPEVDETVEIALSAADGAALGGERRHLLTIEDDDRRVLIDVVEDAGARADGVTDDRAALQKAIDRAAEAGGGVVVLPPGVYRIGGEVRLRENVALDGEGAVLRRAPRLGKWARMLLGSYSGASDSKPFVLRGLTLDGNRAEQGDGDVTQQHLVFLEGGRASPGRLVALVERCQFRDGAAAGLYLYRNVAATVRRVEASNLPGGGWALGGGNAQLSVCDYVGRRPPGGAGAGILVNHQATGFGGSRRSEVRIERASVVDGPLELAPGPGSVVTAEGLVAGPPIYLYLAQARTRLTDARLNVGPIGAYFNRIICPGELLVERSTVRVVPEPARRPGDAFAALHVHWSHGACGGPQSGQRLTLREVTFEADPVLAGREIALVRAEADLPERDNVLTLQGGRAASAFSTAVLARGGHLVLEGLTLEAPLRVSAGGGARTTIVPPGRAELRLSDR